MSETPFDQDLANKANAVDQCMKLGAVIIKSPSQPTIGFTTSQPNGVEIGRQVAKITQTRRKAP